MFVNREEAARIDRAEARLSRTVAAALADSGTVGVLVRPVAGGIAVYARPGSPMNKVIGAGFDGLLDEADLDAIEEAWGIRGEPVRAEVSALVEPEVLGQLQDRGYRLLELENVLGLAVDRATSRAPGAPSGIEVARAAPEETELWRETIVVGFAHPDGTGAVAEEIEFDALEQVIDDFSRAPGFLRYLARVDGQLAGAATMRLDDGVAQLCGAATVPSLRRRGVQGALLAARLRDAAAAGCDIAVITTAPGSQSQRNSQRRGFQLLYVRVILVRQ